MMRDQFLWLNPLDELLRVIFIMEKRSESSHLEEPLLWLGSSERTEIIRLQPH